MTLDLDDLTLGWDCPPGELRARTVVGREGEELIQLRVDLGVMQMFPAGRPDGQRYRGLPSVCEYIEHELRIDAECVGSEDWSELERELLQTNYRRLAFSALTEEALDADDGRAAGFLRHALADIDACLQGLELMREHDVTPQDYTSLRPTLVFDRGRLSTQLAIVEGHYEEAIERAEAGTARLETLLREIGVDDEQLEQDPGLRYLRGLSVELRREYGIAQTLREQLEEALEDEDYEAAAELRDELRRREAAEAGDDAPAS